jgi:hypothetical protein
VLVAEPARAARPRRALHRAALVAGALLLFLVLVAPAQADQLTPAALLRIPVEGIAAAALLLVLPGRARRATALLLGVGLAVLTLLRALDMGFLAVAGRPFDPLFDWGQVVGGLTVVAGPTGAAGTAGLAVAGGALVVALAVLLALTAVRLADLAAHRRGATVRGLVVLGVAWTACAAVGAQVVAPVPVASRSAASLAVRVAGQVPVSLADQRAFTEQAHTDAFRDVPGSQLLTALAGKDVVVVFVESYGRSALTDPTLAPGVGRVLDDGTRRLAGAGYGARSGFLTSSVTGGGSWLAHATLLSGVRVTHQHSYETLVAGERTTLTGAFRRAGWETVAVMPSNEGPWPASGFYGIDRVHDAASLGNRSAHFAGFQTPDQFTLAAFERLERDRAGRGPIMAEIPLVTSHWPWAHVPRLVGWDEVGDGAVYDTMPAGDHAAAREDPDAMRAGYGATLEYSLSTLVSYVETHGDDDLVVLALGDHQPAAFLTGEGAGRDVPVSVITRDRDVLDRVAGWGWEPGMRPGPQAPVWPMEAFRDRFLTTFSPALRGPAPQPVGPVP